MSALRRLRALGPIAFAASVGACGFDAHPKNGTVACHPEGAACCPEGYVCVGRGMTVGGAVSDGTCWYKDDLPLVALALTHDHTPGIPNDPACLVTDWVPALTGTDGGAGGTLDGGAMDVDTPDVGGLPFDAGGSGGGLDLGADVPLGQDLAADAWVGGDGSASPVDASPQVALDATTEASWPTPHDAAADAMTKRPVDTASTDAAADAPRLTGPDAADDVPPSLDLGEAGATGPETADTSEASLDLRAGGEAGGADLSAASTFASISTEGDRTCAAVFVPGTFEEDECS